jgi:hypothetical protein
MIDKIINWVDVKWALRGLVKKFRREIVIDSIMKDWISACIIERKQEGRRKEFLDKQKEIEEKELFYKWIKSR